MKLVNYLPYFKLQNISKYQKSLLSLRFFSTAPVLVQSSGVRGLRLHLDLLALGHVDAHDHQAIC